MSTWQTLDNRELCKSTDSKEEIYIEILLSVWFSLKLSGKLYAIISEKGTGNFRNRYLDERLKVEFIEIHYLYETWS